MVGTEITSVVAGTVSREKAGLQNDSGTFPGDIDIIIMVA